MKINFARRITSLGASFALALLCGMPAVADDTELLLFNPDPSQNPKPNVMFILDSSGSMTETRETTEPYDSDQTYATGDCDTNRLYWTDVDVVPDCSSGTTRYFEKSMYHCDYSTREISGLGSYTDTMVMFRPADPNETASDQYSWKEFAPGFHDFPVECEEDSGDHGDGSNQDDVYARRGEGLQLNEAFTSDPDAEVSWGSPPRNISYTVYDGNYLNWKSSPVTATLSKTFIMKEVIKKVLGSVANLNVGLMRFDGNDGGPVILDITDLDQNRQAVLDAIDGLPAGGNTPLSETMYEAALFWRGMPAYFGQATYTDLTDPDALAQLIPPRYEQPDWDACAKNYNVLLTDGEPTEDLEAATLIGNLPDVAGTLGYTGCDGTALAEGGECLDDIAEYLSVKDIDPNTDGDQLVTTHTIGFDVDLPILSETATDSDGQYFLANNVESLTKTLLSIVADVTDLSLSFAAPAISVNTFNRTQNLNDLYITTFAAQSRAHWPGNVKKYRVVDGVIVDKNEAAAVDLGTGFFKTTAQDIWSAVEDGNNVRLGGAANELPDPTQRKLYTNNGSADLTATSNHISTGNAPAFNPADFGLSGATGEPTLLEMIRWARGEDVRNNNTGARLDMGDPLHSQPAAVVYGGSATNPDTVVYAATNDGYLHAIAGDTGEELWAFIPKELLPNLTRLYFDPKSKYKQYGIDGNIVPIVKDVDNDGVIETGDGDFVYLVFGMRRGGETYYALNVSNKNAPRLLWDVSLPQFGETWSTPVVTRINIDSATQNADKAVVVVGGGYDNVHDSAANPADPDAKGAGIHFLDLVSGAELWRAGADNGADLELSETDREMDRAIPNEVRVIDLSGDGYADRMYATDMGGQILRFDIRNGQPRADLVTGGVIAQLGAEGNGSASAETRRFYNAPDVALVTDAEQQRRYISISVGSGYRAHPFDLSASDVFYSVRDADVFNMLSQNAYDIYDIARDGDMVEVSGQTQTVITSDDRGWKFTLPDKQKILADSLTFDDQIFFVAFSPDSAATSSCSAGKGTNFLYRVSALNGDPVVPNISALDPLVSDDERRETLAQGGIAPSPALLFPSPEPDCTGEACDPEPIYCVGVECDAPGFVNNPVRTLWTQDGIE